MNASFLHPTDQTLGAYGLGKLDDASAAAVNAHLETCQACRRRTAEMTQDSFLGKFRDGRPAAGSLMSLGGPVPTQSVDGVDLHAPDELPLDMAAHPNYDIVRELGRGGMGVVYLVRNRLMDRHEVLKVMGGHLVERPEVRERFLREIRAVASLRHPNIVAAHHAFHVDGSIAFTMEYVDGYDLSRMVKSRGPLPVAHACLFAHQAAQALQYAHEEGMVHRDIKPSNLMVARRGEKAVVKVLDFGLAKATSEGQIDAGLTHEGQMLGTPDFIAPEQIIDAQAADIRADIYSLGCTLYYLLTGGPPFHATSLYDLLQAHHSMDAMPLNLARPEVPSELAALVAKILAKDPARRFRTPAEVSEALAPFYKTRTAPLRPATPAVPRAAPPEARQPSPAASPPPTEPAPPAPGAPKPAGTPRPEVMWASLIDFRESKPEAGRIKPAVAASPRPRRLWPAVASAVLAFGLLAAWMGGMIRIRTPDGTLVLDGVPENAEVFIDGGVATLTPSGVAKSFEFSVAPGTHKVRVRHGDASWASDDVVIVAGEKARPIHVYLERSAPDVAAKKPDAPRSSAPPLADAKGFRGQHYKGFPEYMTWHEARDKCKEMGGRLAVVKDDAENRFITDLLRASNLESAWLGATDEAVEGKWVWVDGSALGYANWDRAAGQPNNSGPGGVVEHYLIAIASRNGAWWDYLNFHTEQFRPGFVCQWDGSRGPACRRRLDLRGVQP